MRDDGLTLEDRYRRVLRLLPGYYRDRWEEDMVGTLLEGRVTGDEDEDEYVYEFGRPAWPEAASVVALAALAAAPRAHGGRLQPRDSARASRGHAAGA